MFHCASVLSRGLQLSITLVFGRDLLCVSLREYVFVHSVLHFVSWEGFSCFPALRPELYFVSTFVHRRDFRYGFGIFATQ